MDKELLQQAPMIRHCEERLEGAVVKRTLPRAVKSMADVGPPSVFTWLKPSA